MAHQPRLPALIGAVLLLLLGAGAVAGASGVAGAALGIVLAAASLTALWLIAESLVPTGRPLPIVQNRAALVLLIKFPIMLALIFLATRLSMGGICCFLVALGLVYFAFVWRLVKSAH